MVRWLRWHCPPDTGFEIRALAVWGRVRYLSVTEAPHNTNFHTWMGKKQFCFFQTAETGNRTPDSGVKGSGANHYPRAPAQYRRSPIGPFSLGCLTLRIFFPIIYDGECYLKFSVHHHRHRTLGFMIFFQIVRVFFKLVFIFFWIMYEFYLSPGLICISDMFSITKRWIMNEDFLPFWLGMIPIKN